MRIEEILRRRPHGVSFEFFPPKSAEGRTSFMSVIADLQAYDPLYVSVTYGAGGSTQDRTVDTVGWIRQGTELTVMSHLTCIGATSANLDKLLRRYATDGIENILAIRGDPPRDGEDFDPSKGEFAYAKDLVEFVSSYGRFCIAVAVYPEGHGESPSLEKDTEYTRMKIDAGADFAITQMFFDNRYFFDFMERAQRAGIGIPILPGIMPITDLEKVMGFASFCNATVPRGIRERMEPFLDQPGEMRKLGIEYATEQCQDLLEAGVRYLHFYTLNRADVVSEIIDSLHLPPNRGNPAALV